MDETRVTSEIPLEERPAQFAPESDDVSYAFDDARFVIEKAKRKRRAADVYIEDEKMMLKAQFEEERNLRCSSQCALRNQTMKVVFLERERNALLGAVREKEREIECIRTSTEDYRQEKDREFIAMMTSMQADYQRLLAERDELKQGTDAQLLSLAGEKARQHCELDAVRVEMQATKIRYDQLRRQAIALQRKCKKMENNSSAVHLRGDTTTRPSTGQKCLEIKEADDHKLEKDDGLASLECRNKKLEHLLIATRNQMVEEGRHLDKTRCEILHLEAKNTELKEQQLFLEVERNRLEDKHGTIQRNLEIEMGKSLCQICMQSPKDTICFPCLHQHYCYLCLEKHRERSETCPSCRTTVCGVIRSYIGV